MGVPVALALVAAIAFAAGNNLQRHAAAKVPLNRGGPVRLILRLLRSRRWLAGALCAGLGLIFHTAALTRGGVILVQAVIASSLVFSLGLEALVERQRPTLSQVGGAVLVGVGIALLVGVGRPGLGGSFQSLRRAAVAWAVVLAIGGGALLLARYRPLGRRTAILMGAAAGACFALDAVFLRGLAGSLNPFDTVTVLINAAGFAVASLLGNLVIQRAFQRAPLRHVLPAMGAAEPMVAFACGRLLFGEHLESGAIGTAAVAVGLPLMVAGVILCALHPPAREPEEVPLLTQ